MFIVNKISSVNVLMSCLPRSRHVGVSLANYWLFATFIWFKLTDSPFPITRFLTMNDLWPLVCQKLHIAQFKSQIFRKLSYNTVLTIQEAELWRNVAAEKVFCFQSSMVSIRFTNTLFMTGFERSWIIHNKGFISSMPMRWPSTICAHRLSN
jgi:hypothetical protein